MSDKKGDAILLISSPNIDLFKKFHQHTVRNLQLNAHNISPSLKYTRIRMLKLKLNFKNVTGIRKHL